MKNTFIERATYYPLEYGQLVVYETNMQCADIAFKFDRHMMAVMLAGHKSVLAENVRFEFFPGTFLIPQKDVIQKIDIPSASQINPTKCLELDFESILHSDQSDIIFDYETGDKHPKSFVSNNEWLLKTFERIYQRRIISDDKANQMIVTLMVKELLLELFQTEGLLLLMQDFGGKKISTPIQRSLDFIKKNITQKITSKQLSEVAGLGLTSFFNKFKEEMNIPPMEYLKLQRVKLAKSFLRSGEYSLKETAYNSGFKSYEHFSITFKKVEGVTPSSYRKAL